MSTRRAGNTPEFSTCVSNASHGLAHSRHSKNICGNNGRIRSDNTYGKGPVSMKCFLVTYIWSHGPQGTYNLDPISPRPSPHRLPWQVASDGRHTGPGALERPATYGPTSALPLTRPGCFLIQTPKIRQPHFLRKNLISVFSESRDGSASSS